MVRPEYTAVFQVPQQNEYGQTYTEFQQVTWPKDGPWNLDIRSFLFDSYLEQIQAIAVNLDSFKTNLISRFLVSDSLKEFDRITSYNVCYTKLLRENRYSHWHSNDFQRPGF